MKSRTRLLVLPFVALVLISCNLLAPGGPVRGSATPDLVQTLTAIAPTSQALVPTSTTGANPSPTTQAATQAPTQAATTSVPVVGITPVVPTAVPTRPAPTAVTRCNWAQFLNDVSVPDGSQFVPGATFVKSWRLKNIGTCTWTPDYQLVFSGGSPMNGPASISINENVPPGDTINVEVNLKAPATAGNYTGYWKLATASGALFGIGGDAQSSFYVNIKVVQTPTEQPPSATRINFRSYATSATVTGNVDSSHIKPYILRAGGGQIMMVNLDSPNQDAFLRIYGVTSGDILVDSGSKQTSWQGRLPSNQDYIIQVISSNTTSFTLTVTIPERISFAPGAISASLSGPLRANEVHTFILRAAAGQTMTLTLTPDDQSVLLAFYGYQNGEPYLRTAAGQTSWTGEVPVTQDYVIQVVSVVGSDKTFTLDVKIQ